MNVVTVVFIFLCGLSVGIVVGRRDERKRAAAPPADAVPPPAPAAAPVAAAEPAPAPVPPEEILPAVAQALTDDPLAVPPPAPLAVPNRKARKAGLDESAFVVGDDILERLRRAEELHVDPAEARSLLEPADDRPRPRPQPLDEDLAEKERRILERLRRQRPEAADEA